MTRPMLPDPNGGRARKRRNFSQALKVAIHKRATRDGVKYCEKCGLPAKKFDVDHIIPEGLRSDADLKRKLTAADGQLLCTGFEGACHRVKTDTKDKPEIAKVARQEAKHVSATKAKGQIKSAGFPKSDKRPAIDKGAIPPLGPSGLARQYGVKA